MRLSRPTLAVHGTRVTHHASRVTHRASRSSRPSPLALPPAPLARAFTLMEVMIAAALFFLAVFSILALVSSTLRNARALRHIQVDAGMVAAQLYKTNRFTEGVETGDFGKDYPEYSWSREGVEAKTNGLWQFDIVVNRKGQSEPVDKMSVFVFSPESTVRRP